MPWLVSREGDFGFSQENGDPSAGHDVEARQLQEPESERGAALRFAFNCKQSDQRHDPDGTPKCAGGERPGLHQPGPRHQPPDHHPLRTGRRGVPGGPTARCATQAAPIRGRGFVNPANAPLVQLPGTGTIWRISRSNEGGDDD